MPRRGINIYKRKDGRWEGRIKKEGNGNGVRKYISVYGKTYAEVKNKMESVKNSIADNTFHQSITLAETVNVWLKDRRPYWKQTTYATYQHMANKYVIPKMGNILINSVNNEILENFSAEIRKDASLSSRYIRSICALALRAMTYVKKSIITRWKFRITRFRL